MHVGYSPAIVFQYHMQRLNPDNVETVIVYVYSNCAFMKSAVNLFSLSIPSLEI